MAIGDCQHSVNHPRVKVEEGKRKAVFLNPEHLEFRVTKVDGCLIVEATAADWMVTKPGAGEVIVELKGRNVEHGAKQIIATAAYWHEQGHRAGKVAGLIVCTQFPKASTGIQKAQQIFSNKYQGPLHVVTKNGEFKIENVLSFKGPHKS